MSRPSIIWILFGVALSALCIVTWHELKESDSRSDASAPHEGPEGSGGQLAKEDGDEGLPITPKHAGAGGLLHSLPVPQSPPKHMNAAARKQWLDELMGLIDEASYLDDVTSLRMLIVEFRNPDEAIAQSAYSSLMARKDRKALPYLEEMSALDLAPAKREQVDELSSFLNSESVFDQLRPKDH